MKQTNHTIMKTPYLGNWKFVQKLLMYLAIASIFTFSACNNDDDLPSTVLDADVIIINEGNFQSADGTISTFNTADNSVNLSVFASTNGFPMAATIQNVIEYNENYYAIGNATDKIEVFRKDNFQSVATIRSGFGAAYNFASPFGFAAVGSKGYLGNWGTLNFTTFEWEGSFIAKIDLSDFSIGEKIDLAEQPQHLLAIGNKIYISLVSSNQIAVLNTDNDQFETPIEVAAGPDKMVIDQNDKLWVICTSGNLVRINTSTNTVEATIPDIQASGFNEKMRINGAGNTLYYLSSTGFNPSTGAVYRFSITDTQAPSAPLITGQNLYGIGIDPDNEEIYVSNSNAFQGNGTVTRYQNNGTAIGTFSAGRGPSGFLFK